jgi:hypothetical protein
MMQETITDIEAIEAPYGKQILLQDVAYENGMHVVRIRIREGQRFTILDLDENSANTLSSALTQWSDKGKV